MPDPFIIFALPRSRTAWLSHWLSYVEGGKRLKRVGHDEFSRCSSIDQCVDLFEGEDALDGTVETGAAFAYQIIKERLPNAKLLVVQRDPMESLASLCRAGLKPEPGDWARRVIDLWSVSGDGVRTIAYRDLDLESCAKWIWDYCLGLPWNGQWWVEWRAMNVQVALPQRLLELHQAGPAIEALKQEVSEALL